MSTTCCYDCETNTDSVVNVVYRLKMYAFMIEGGRRGRREEQHIPVETCGNLFMINIIKIYCYITFHTIKE